MHADVAELAIRASLKMMWPQGHVGSTPTIGTYTWVLFQQSQLITVSLKNGLVKWAMFSVILLPMVVYP